MTEKMIVINGVEPAPLSIRHPLGIDLDLYLTMQRQDKTPVDPTLTQFVLFPRSLGGTFPYDMEAFDLANGIARVEVPGTSLNDLHGYSLEVYARAPNDVPGDPPKPTGLIARGSIVTEGSGYASQGPLELINVPTVIGPQGPAGPTGQRGSIWTTGAGTPNLIGALNGDMYLDELTGNVWRYDGAAWVMGTF